MLRLYKPITDDIFKLHTLLEHLVCNVWCEACDDICDDKLQSEFKTIYHYAYKSTKEAPKALKDEVERIYELFKVLSPEQKQLIKQAFITNNDIENLCNGNKPIYLNQLPDIVTNDIKPLFKWCYEALLDQGKVPGDKMDYYKKLIKHNSFHVCPCCGLIDLEHCESKYREAYDHYLPKSIYPFASVNFKNLVPICYKCNSDRKKAKDPIEEKRIAFYPFSTIKHTINISSNYILSPSKKTIDVELNSFSINFTGDTNKINTWKWLFDIEERYENKIKSFAKTFLAEVKRNHRRNLKLKDDFTFSETINDLIINYKYDYYDDKKFLKIAFLEGVLKDQTFLNSISF